MITLYAFGPAMGLPDPSPFVMKAQTLLKMSGQPFRVDTKGFSRAPKGKLPYIDDDGEIVADSTFIRWHLEKKYNIDLDRGLAAEARAVAWAFEKMAEDQLYWALMDARWTKDVNFDRGPRAFFQAAPAPIRPLIANMVRRRVRGNLRAQGIGRHSQDEIAALGTRSIDAIAAFLGDKRFFMGAEPLGVDAAMFSFTAGALCPLFDTPIRSAAERHENLRGYVARMMERFYPDFVRAPAAA